MMKSLCVFCGSSTSNDPVFLAQAKLLGKTLAKEKITLVYGGANIGLMGTVADAALAAGGKVIGVLPRFLAGKEIAHKNLSQLILCDSMHERKKKMFELSQGFIALPGGFGTLEEVCEMLTWQQLGLHSYPIGFLNVNKFYQPLDEMFQGMTKKELLKVSNRKMAIFKSSVPMLLKAMKAYKATPVPKWIKKSELKKT